MKQFIARQPIFDHRMSVYAYELLYRFDGEHNFAGTLLNPDRASSETVMSTFHSLGIEKITGGKLAFINFTSNLIEAGVATLFPSRYLVVEILEDVMATPAVLKACRELKQAGYMLALDDFRNTPERRQLLALADIIKVDWLNTPKHEIEQLAANLGPDKPILLAEKIETREMFDKALAMHFSLFQGYFFSRPTILSEKKVEPLMVNYLRLIRLVNRKEVDFTHLANIIRRDVVLSYRLLRLVNSVYFGMRYMVKDIQHGLAILGMKEIRKWISLLAMVGINTGKTPELVRMSMIRGRFLEVYGQLHLASENTEVLFMIGLFSLIDVILEQPMPELMAQMSVPAEVSAPLLTKNGMEVVVLDMLASYEQGLWEEVLDKCVQLGLSEQNMTRLYLDAVLWCNEFME